MTGIGEAVDAASPPFGVDRPRWLTAHGDAHRLEVLRSPLVTERKRMYALVRQFIAAHGLVLAARESFEDCYWMGGAVEMSVYVPPADRNASYARVLSWS